ncbi:MAG: ThiF family adenylyltransferase [Candidatus Nanohaloarchaea archaeon]
MRYNRLDPVDVDTAAVRDATVAVVGAGATGSRMLEQLARVGARLRIVDRDYLEESNLATSTLYTTEQVEDGLPKAVAAEHRLTAINPNISIDARVADLNHRTADDHLAGVDIVLDGTDNMETRHLVNEYCVKHGVPWVHVSALAQRAEVMPVVPGETACFNCVFGDVDGTALATCETAGIVPAAAATAASLGVTTAIDILNGADPQGLVRADLGTGRFHQLAVERQRCRVCSDGSFPYLDGEAGSTAATVCGEDKYQIHGGSGGVDLASLEEDLEAVGEVTRNDHLLRFDGEARSPAGASESTDAERPVRGDEQFTVFADGRMIVEADSREAAKNVYARFVGS